MEGILLFILALVQFFKFKIWRKIKADSSLFSKAFFILLAIGLGYFTFKTFSDLGHLREDFEFSIFRPLLVDLGNLSRRLLTASHKVEAGWVQVGLKSYQALLAILGLINISFFYFRKRREI